MLVLRMLVSVSSFRPYKGEELSHDDNAEVCVCVCVSAVHTSERVPARRAEGQPSPEEADRSDLEAKSLVWISEVVQHDVDDRKLVDARSVNL